MLAFQIKGKVPEKSGAKSHAKSEKFIPALDDDLDGEIPNDWLLITQSKKDLHFFLSKWK
jgi:hypothetical protein